MEIMKKLELYFAFGSNLLSAQMKERCPSSYPLKRVTLPDFELCFPFQSSKWQGRGVAGIQRREKKKVKGVLYSLSKECLHTLDEYEGHPLKYRRQRIFVFDEQGRELQVWTYFPNDPVTDAFHPPSPEYLDRILKGAYEHKLPKSYLDFLHSIPTE
jgi:gamma-glutamylcyclotransferase